MNGYDRYHVQIYMTIGQYGGQRHPPMPNLMTEKKLVLDPGQFFLFIRNASNVERKVGKVVDKMVGKMAGNNCLSGQLRIKKGKIPWKL